MRGVADQLVLAGGIHQHGPAGGQQQLDIVEGRTVDVDHAVAGVARLGAGRNGHHRIAVIRGRNDAGVVDERRTDAAPVTRVRQVVADAQRRVRAHLKPGLICRKRSRIHHAGLHRVACRVGLAPSLAADRRGGLYDSRRNGGAGGIGDVAYGGDQAHVSQGCSTGARVIGLDAQHVGRDRREAAECRGSVLQLDIDVGHATAGVCAAPDRRQVRNQVGVCGLGIGAGVDVGRDQPGELRIGRQHVVDVDVRDRINLALAQHDDDVQKLIACA